MAEVKKKVKVTPKKKKAKPLPKKKRVKSTKVARKKVKHV